MCDLNIKHEKILFDEYTGGVRTGKFVLLTFNLVLDI
jgi:hypothetical protein